MVSVSLRVSELSVGVENAGSKCACPSPTGIPRAWAGEMTLSLRGPDHDAPRTARKDTSLPPISLSINLRRECCISLSSTAQAQKNDRQTPYNACTLVTRGRGSPFQPQGLVTSKVCGRCRHWRMSSCMYEYVRVCPSRTEDRSRTKAGPFKSKRHTTRLYDYSAAACISRRGLD